MEELVPIKIKITRGLKKGVLTNIYPDFNQIPEGIRDGLDWSYYFDTYGIGWHYDSKSGFGEGDDENPDPHVMYGCTCVPQIFASAAKKLFPDLIEVLNEEAFEKFYNDRAHFQESEFIEDERVLQALSHKRSLGIEETQHDKDALNPESPKPGIVKNKNKSWDMYKQKRRVKIIGDLSKDGS